MERVNLPDDIIRQVTKTSLDVKSIIKCMVVCKPWRNLISELISNNLILAKGDIQFLVYDYSLNRFGAHDDETHHIAWMKTLNFPSAGWGTLAGRPDSPRVTSSCNGLICLLGPHNKDIYICNPILGEYVSIPNPKHVRDDFISQYDLGFCPSSNEYKLTTFTWNTLEICTLGHPTRWRSVPFEVRELGRQGETAIYVSGVFHWLLKTENVLTFNLEKEVFGSIPLPLLEDDKKIYQLECMDDCLVVTSGHRLTLGLDIWVTARYRLTLGLDIWVRKEDKFSGESGWTKNWVIGAPQSFDQIDIYSRFKFTESRPQKLSSDGRIFMPTVGCSYRSLCSYDPRNKLVGFGYLRSKVLAYTPTLISPKKLMQKMVED